MDTPVVLSFYITPSSNSSVTRSKLLKDYFSKLTPNVEVLYPTQIHNGLLLCKSKRTEEKITNMRHILSNGSVIHLLQIPRQLFQPIKTSIDGQLMQLNEINASLQQCLPFLHASGGKIQVNPDKSIIFEGNIFILNSVHSYLVNKTLKQNQSNPINTSESLDLRSGTIHVKVMSGKLLEQNVEGIIIPMNGKCKIHKAFERQIQTFGGVNFLNYFKELSTKHIRSREGDITIFPNRELKIPTKYLITFTVPRLPINENTKDKSIIDSFQSTYEQMIYRALQTIDQNGITSLAMPVLEPNIKLITEKRQANEMAVRAMVSTIRQFSQITSIKLKRILIIDHHVQIKRINKRVKKYQNQIQSKTASNNNNNNIDLDTDQERSSFAKIFGVPQIPEVVSSTSESDDEIELEDYQTPYVDHAKS